MLLLAQIHPAVTGILIAVFLFICVLMMLVVLIQRPAGGGLSGAFGSGSGSGQTAFGAKTGDALTMATIAVFVLYLLFAIGLNFAARPPGDAPPDAPAAVPEETVPPAAPISPGMEATQQERLESDPEDPPAAWPDDPGTEAGDPPAVEPADPATAPEPPDDPEAASPTPDPEEPDLP